MKGKVPWPTKPVDVKPVDVKPVAVKREPLDVIREALKEAGISGVTLRWAPGVHDGVITVTIVKEEGA